MAYSAEQTDRQRAMIWQWLKSALGDSKVKEVFGTTDKDAFINAKRTRWEASELIQLLQSLDNDATEENLFSFKLLIESAKPIK